MQNAKTYCHKQKKNNINDLKYYLFLSHVNYKYYKWVNNFMTIMQNELNEWDNVKLCDKIKPGIILVWFIAFNLYANLNYKCGMLADIEKWALTLK